MCTIVLLRRPDHPWPLLLAANRDEMLTRSALPPSRHWPDQPQVIAGRDLEAGGTWLGLNDRGLVAAISNRRGSLGPARDMRSRGELPLKALAHHSAARAAADLAQLDADRYRPFNLVIADCRDAFWLCNREAADAIDCIAIPEGLSMLTAAELDDRTSPRIAYYLPQFRQAAAPRPGAGDWAEWQALLADHRGADADDPNSAMTVVADGGFGTVSSSLIALRRASAARPIWLYAAGRPDETAFEPVAL